MLKFLIFFGDLLYIIFKDIPSHKFGDSTQETVKEIVRWKRLRPQTVGRRKKLCFSTETRRKITFI